MKKNEEWKGYLRRVGKQILWGWRRIPQAIRIFLIVSAFAGITLLTAGLFQSPKNLSDKESAAFDKSETDLSGAESSAEKDGSGMEVESSGQSGGMNTESSGESGGTGAESTGKSGQTETDSSGKPENSGETESSGKPENSGATESSEKTGEGTEGSGKSGEKTDSTKKIRKLIALTYDDGPSDSTPLILDTLEKYGVKATFFVVGRDQVEYHSEGLVRAYNDGMEIGSHTYDHRILSKSTQEQIWETMRRNDEVIQNAIGFTPAIMRPTGGGINDTVRASIDRPMILWNIDTLDWKYEDRDTVVNIVKAEAHPGAIILMHDLL